MGLTFKEALDQQLINELARLFNDEGSIITLLARAEIPEERLRMPASRASRDYWIHVCRELDRGMVAPRQLEDGSEQNGLDRLMAAAADEYPGNDVLRPYATENRSTQPGQRPDDSSQTPPQRQQLEIQFSHALNVEQIRDLLQLCQGHGLRLEFDASSDDRSQLVFTTEGSEPESTGEGLLTISQQVLDVLLGQGVQASSRVVSAHFSDYYMDPLYVEGPDQARFELERVPASTRVRDVIRIVIDNYHDDFFPPDQTGAPRRAVLDQVNPNDGSGRRLSPDDTLHQAGVRPHDTVRVSPDARAGAVNPNRRKEALVAVKNQLIDFCDSAAANQVEFNATADDPDWPTEYLLTFRVPSVAPPAEPGSMPILIEYHEVLMTLPPDFPVYAPIAQWQTPIYHPNICSLDERDAPGLVCMGELQHSYRPGLNFAVLCQMLIDMARYRNYVLHEHYNKAAAHWAQTEQGRHIIVEQLGGCSHEQVYGLDAAPPARSLTLRKLD
ncbi:MAG: effector-associated domain EAD1-containing protein [Proteobacteria bacterium]|nr:effector-associated domain EAD1-containing protein [Pseudomonadota bacterium]